MSDRAPHGFTFIDFAEIAWQRWLAEGRAADDETDDDTRDSSAEKGSALEVKIDHVSPISVDPDEEEIDADDDDSADWPDQRVADELTCSSNLDASGATSKCVSKVTSCASADDVPSKPVLPWRRGENQPAPPPARLMSGLSRSTNASTPIASTPIAPTPFRPIPPIVSPPAVAPTPVAPTPSVAPTPMAPTTSSASSSWPPPPPPPVVSTGAAREQRERLKMNNTEGLQRYRNQKKRKRER